MTLKTKKAKTTDFTPDPHNANRGTERGLKVLENSLAEVGLGRSIVVDKNGVVIAGNKTLERAVDQGFTEALIIETQGDQLIVVQRTDLDLSGDDTKARKLAYYDNRASEVGLSWDAEVIMRDVQSGLDLSALFSDDELQVFITDNQLVDAPETFPTYDEDIETEHQCPKCGYKWSGKSAIADE